MAGQSTAALRTSAPTWATADRLVGRAQSAQVLSIQVHLGLRNQAAAEAELYAVNDPASPRYGQFLSAEDFATRYAPTPGDVAQVSGWLAEQGLHVDSVADNRLFISAHGTVEQIETAFGTQLGIYRVGTQQLRAPMTPPMVPARFAQLISTAVGLHDATVRPHNVRVGGVRSSQVIPHAAPAIKPADTPPPPDGSHDPQPCALYWNQIQDNVDPAYGGGFPDPLPFLTCGYTPPRLRAAYGFSEAVDKGQDGHGATVAILDAFQASPTLFSDTQAYSAANDADYILTAAQFKEYADSGSGPAPPDPDPGEVQGWWGEQTLDVQAVHAIAPGADIMFVSSRSNYDIDFISALNHIVDHDLASIISNSWGQTEYGALNQVAYNAVATAAGLKGIGIYFAAGDGGDGSFGGFEPASPGFPASLPNVTGVGGTSLGIGQKGNRAVETGWETGISVLEPATATTPAEYSPGPPGFFEYGGGGGTSGIYAQPKYQKGIVPAAIADIYGTPARAEPDVSMVGDPFTGFLVGETLTFPDGVYYSQYTIGGTSLATPLFAGAIALIESKNHHRVGFANPALYAAHKTAFVDVLHVPTTAVSAILFNNGLDNTQGTTDVVATFDWVGQAIQTGPGFDNVTGLGSPNGQKFLDAIH